MAQLPLDEAIARLKGNEERIDKFVNDTGSYETSGGQSVETIRALNERLEAEFDAAQADLYAARDNAQDAAGDATQAKIGAETARDAAFVNANVYADTAAGLAATTNGQQFQVVVGAEIIRYRRDSATVATEVARFPRASRVTDLETDMLLVEQQLGRPLTIDYAKGSVGTDSPNAFILGAGVFAPVNLQPVTAKLAAVRFRLRTAGTYEIHAFRRLTETTWKVDAVWPGVSGVTGLVTLEAGGGIIPGNYILQPGDFVGISVGTARTGYAVGTNWVNINNDTGVGAVVTRTINTNGYDISIAYDYGGGEKNVDERLTALEASATASPTAVDALASTILLAPPGSALPAGYADTGVTLLGIRMIAPAAGAVIADVFESADGFAIMPSLSAMYQDASASVVAAAADDPVRSIVDLTPSPVAISAPGDTNRPLLKHAGGARYLRFDGGDDRLTYPASVINSSSFSFVCSVAYRGGGFFSQVIGDASESGGLFCGFESNGRPRFSAGGQAVLSAPTPVPLNTRVTLSFVYDGANRYIYQNGVLVASVATTGQFTPGTQPLICYSGANVVTSPIDLYGAVLIGKALTTDERQALEALVAADGSIVSGAVLQAAVDAAKQEMMLEFGSYFGLVSTVDTKSYALGDSTVAAYAGGTAIMGLINSIRTEVDLSVPGHTIAQQQAAWDAQTIVASDVGWVVMQIGLNDLNPAEAASVAIGRLQTLVNTIKGEIGTRKLLVSQMIPCRQRLINIYGATNGPIAYQKWLDMNAAIAGTGTTPITNVDGRITAHVPLMNDGNGNLRPEYDTGDGIHPNTAGRQVNATAWVNALQQAGLAV